MAESGEGSRHRHSSSNGGRPSKEITREKLESLQRQNFTAKQMASLLNCSSSLIYSKLQSFGMQQRKKYSSLTDTELDAVTSRLHDNHPNAGLKMMCGFLEGEGLILQRSRVRDSLSRVVGDSGVQRRVLVRRQYKVPSPNSIWHIDGHMKLIRWGICTHGCIDGYSRVVIYLHSSTNNKAATVFNLFLKGVLAYGIPSRVRSDHGGENSYVALFMNLVNGLNHHITGKSVHNQRIERLWGDVHQQVTSSFYSNFYEMEDCGKLNINNENHIKALHAVFLPEINQRLTTFVNGWNKHNIRTESSSKPEQLWMTGALANQGTGISAVDTIETWNHMSLKNRINQALNNYGIDPSAMEDIEEDNTEDYVSVLREQFSDIFSQDLSLMEKYDQLKEVIRN